jgi:hypothetical protein
MAQLENHTEEAGTEEVDRQEQLMASQEALLVVSLRTYDLLLALLRATDSDAAAALVDMHKKGGFAGPQPYVDEEFLRSIEQL